MSPIKVAPYPYLANRSMLLESRYARNDTEYGFLGVVTSDFMVSFSYQSHRNTELKLAVIFRNAIIVPHQTFPMVAKSSTA
ncbi:hypothetical protein T4E_3482 [Trichinella pseudospiralis]|uniref:Uncharacterized protein n=1 Tax=Trichinella pseudospiralis TaxID=6337 RepID=A0A0V0YIT5_TRIPS|nr:hypothetical protein T4E_3482 [Trichinella pseudospiralis]